MSKEKKNLEKLYCLRKNSTCLFNDVEKVNCKCEKKTKENHLIQKAYYLKSIAKNGRVITFNDEEKSFYDRYMHSQERNINKINKFNVFCGNHDKDLFFDIENGNEFNKDNKKQCFQFALRAFTFNFSKICVRSNFKLRNIVFEKRGYITLERDMLTLEKFKECYKNDKYDEIETVVIELDKKIKWISCSCFYPFFDINHIYRGYINDKIFFNIFPNKEKSLIIMSYFKKSSKHCKKFCRRMEQYSKKNQKKLERYITKIICIHDKNIVLGPELYDRWSESEKKSFLEYNFLFRRPGIKNTIKGLMISFIGKPKFTLFEDFK